MKILIPAATWRDSFAENVAYALKGMGHEVLTSPVAVDAGRLGRLHRGWIELRGKLGRDVPLPAERWALKAAGVFRPDIVLALTQQMTEETLAGLKALGVKRCVAWWADAPANMKRWGLLTPGWDILFLKDEEAVAKFRRVGRNAHQLHEAMNPAWHRKVATCANDSVVVAGNIYAYRQALVSRLQKNGVSVRLYGGALPRWALTNIKAAYSATYLAKEEKSRVFGEALGCLNSTSFAEGNSLNARAFEVAGAGGLQLMEHKAAIEQCFEPGKEILTFKTFEELREQIAWAEKAPGEAAKVREAGARRAVAEHTYEHRLRRLLELVGVS